MVTRGMLTRRLDRSGVTMGVTAGVEQNGTQTEGGVYQNRRGGCHTAPVVFSLSLFVFLVLARRCRTAPAERERTGATPPFLPLARHGYVGGGTPGVPLGVPSPTRRWWGRSRPYVSMLEGSDARQRLRADAPTRGVMLDHFIRIVVGGVVRPQRPPSAPPADGRLGDVLRRTRGR